MQHSKDAHFNTDCVFEGCLTNLRSFIGFKRHISNEHSATNETLNFKCDLCEIVTTTLNEFYKHYYIHIDQILATNSNQSIKCFYNDCGYKSDFGINMKDRFKRHLSQKHAYRDGNDLKRNNSIF